jgi:hypothetical protein
MVSKQLTYAEKAQINTLSQSSGINQLPLSNFQILA